MINQTEKFQLFDCPRLNATARITVHTGTCVQHEDPKDYHISFITVTDCANKTNCGIYTKISSSPYSWQLIANEDFNTACRAVQKFNYDEP